MLTNTDGVELADRLRLVVGRLARRLRQQSLGGLTPSQRSVLATLYRSGAVTLSRLAELEGVSRPAVSRASARLEERGLIERRTNPDDGRSSLVALAPEGEETLAKGRQERTAYLAVRLERLDRNERQLLMEALPVLDRLVEDE